MLRWKFCMCWNGRYILCHHWHMRGLVNTYRDAFWVLAGVWSTQVHIHFMRSLAWDVFDQHELRCILCASWLGMDLFNTSWDTFWVLAGMGLVCPTHVAIDFLSVLAWDCFANTCLDSSSHVEMHFACSLIEFWKHKLRCILWPRWHVMGFSLAGMRWFW